MSDLTIVMYHYVRELKGSKYPNIKGLEFEGFRRQLDHLQSRCRMIGADELIGSATEGRALPEDSCLLTFDDGYRDHFDFVMPELVTRGLTGAFFPPVKAIVGRETLDVNAIHFILERCGDDLARLVADLDAAVRANGMTDAELAERRARLATPGRYDPAEVMYVKRMLQHELPEDVRNAVVARLFDVYVGLDPRAFADELYITVDDAREMVDAGMYVGSHGDKHVWFDKTPRAEQAREIDVSLDFLASIGAPARNWIMCYPYGAYDADTLELLAARNCAAGLTTRVGVARPSTDAMLELPRMNTNDFPQ